MQSTSPVRTTISLPSIQNLSAPSRMYVTCSFSWLCSGTTEPFFSRTRASMILSPLIICRSSKGFNCSSSTSFQAMCFNMFEIVVQRRSTLDSFRLSARPRERASCTAAFNCQFQSVHHAQHVFVGNGDWRFAQQCIAHIGIKQAIVSRQSSDFLSANGPILRRVQRAPFVWVFSAPSVVAGNLATFQRFFLRIDSILYECAGFTVKEESQLRSQSYHPGAQHRSHSGITKNDVEGIIDQSAIAFDTDIGGNRFRASEQQHRLIDEVNAKVEEYSASCFSSFPPRSRPTL